MDHVEAMNNKASISYSCAPISGRVQLHCLRVCDLCAGKGNCLRDKHAVVGSTERVPPQRVPFTYLFSDSCRVQSMVVVLGIIDFWS